MEIQTSIIPRTPTFVKVKGLDELDLKAICVFAAIGFFLDTDTYWRHEKVLAPASINELDSEGFLLNSTPYFKWYNSPRELTFEQALDEFANLFETIVQEQTQGRQVILPLSGGLDSRTQAVALQRIGAEVSAYSYSFENGYPESAISQQIADVCGFDFESFTIGKGYLWRVIDDLAALNGCYSDFTSPRQMAVLPQLAAKGDVFSLGHWGDVLFDSMGLPDLTEDEQVDVMVKKLLKRGGLQLATTLWKVWGLEGDFETYFRGRIQQLLGAIAIDDTNAKLRAFKSMYWAPRWTSVNLSVFESLHPITLPYYDDRMCAFICTLPDAYLKDRRLQIAYIKTYAPELARITWQDQRPFNLTNYKLNRFPYHIPYKFGSKLKREVKTAIGKPYVQRNWELQFLGATNRTSLEQRLFTQGMNDWIPDSLLKNYVEDFYTKDALGNAHALNMLLVLSQFYNTRSHG